MEENACIFCKIAQGEIPSATIYEDKICRVILDISPGSRGHAILIVKEHADDLFSLSEETAAAILPVIKKVATAMKKTLGCIGMNILQNNGLAAGQTVFHYHVHFLPRYEGDEITITWKQGKAEDPEKLATAIRENIEK